jgi:chemotaxis methyl-accepting protein methylase
MTIPSDARPTVGPAVRARLRRIPAAVRLVQAVRDVAHKLTLRFARRRNYHYTKFCRLPAQLDVFAGDVVDFLHRGDRPAEIRIVVFGCSIGAEPYSIASILRSRRPDIRFHVECFDIEPAVIARAEAATYSLSELTTSPPVTSTFMAKTFDPIENGVAVKPEIACKVRFTQGDVLDNDLIRGLGQADVVVAQNFLYHLGRPDAERAFANLFSLLKPRAALLVDGADLDMRTRLTAAAGLRPCATDLERIHNESRIMRGSAWPHIYWGLEPFDSCRTDAPRRYATIFFSEQ